MNILKKIFNLIGLVSVTWASTMARADHGRIHLVLDARNAPHLPRNFRVAPELHIAGGAQYSEMGLQQIIERLQVGNLMVIDLRQESHGFLNGNAISWYGPQDAANAGKSAQVIEADQQKLLMALSEQKNVNVGHVLKKAMTGGIEKTQAIVFSVQRVMSEAELADKFHLKYQRLYVQDFHAPTIAEVNRFIKLVRDLPPTQWIYFHCHAGVGRTTTFMVMFDMMRNAKHESFNAILARQKTLGGKDLTLLPTKTSFKYAAADQRLIFLRNFYEYARSNDDNFKTLFA
jgi:hypothetical protein